MQDKNIKALLLLGGKGTRLRPLTDHINKHEICIGGKCMIEHSLDNIVATGIKDISVISSDNYSDPNFVDLILKKYNQKDTDLKFHHTKASNMGTAYGVKVMKKYLDDSYYVHVFGDVIYESSKELIDYVSFFKKSQLEGMLLLARAPHPERHATPIIKNGKIVEVIEKHQNPGTSFVVTTWDIYPPQATDYVERLSPSNRNELEISDLRNVVLKHHTIGSMNYKGWWIDAGIPSDLLKANRLVLTTNNVDSYIDSLARVTNSKLNMVTLSGPTEVTGSRLKNVIVQGNIKITNSNLENCVVMGNAFLKDAHVKNRISFNDEIADFLEQ